MNLNLEKFLNEIPVLQPWRTYKICYRKNLEKHLPNPSEENQRLRLTENWRTRVKHHAISIINFQNYHFTPKSRLSKFDSNHSQNFLATRLKEDVKAQIMMKVM